jgi:cytochrome c peroxidase
MFPTLIAVMCLAADPASPQTAALREPSALAIVDGRLFVANRRSGTVSVVDPAAHLVLGEYHVADRLSDLAAAPGAQRLVALDESRNEVLLVHAAAGRIAVESCVAVAKTPVTVCVSRTQGIISVASHWARRLTILKVTAPESEARDAYRLHEHATIDLPFSPREQCLTADESRLIVADAFGGELAVIDPESCRVESLHTMDVHNIRGLAVNRATNELVVPHQALIQHLSTTRDHIFWGNIVGNFVKAIPLDDLKPGFGEKAGFRRVAHWSLDALGGPGKGAGDPGDVVMTNDGKLAVTLSGVDQLALRSAPNKPFAYLPVGARPAALAVSPDQQTLYVANSFDDTISVVALDRGEVAATISLGPWREPTAAERGERLFYDARLSLHGWYSCHSCHTDGHTIGLLNDNLGDDALGDPKRIPSLLGVGRTGPWGWNGGKKELAAQIHGSIVNTMHGAEQAADSANVADLEAYLRTLEPPPSITAARTLRRAGVRQPPGPNATEASPDSSSPGRTVFESRGCATCHAPPDYTSSATYDVGIHDRSGQTKFNPPSLRGVVHRGPYFHDNRAATLRDVFARYHHGDTEDISDSDLDDLLEFLSNL